MEEEDTWPFIYFDPELTGECRMCFDTCEIEHTGFFILLDGSGDTITKICFGCAMQFAHTFQATALSLAQADQADSHGHRNHAPTVEPTLRPPIIELVGPEDEDWIISA